VATPPFTKVKAHLLRVDGLRNLAQSEKL